VATGLDICVKFSWLVKNNSQKISVAQEFSLNPKPFHYKETICQGSHSTYLFTFPIHLSYSLDEEPPKLFCFFAMSQFDWAITQKQMEPFFYLAITNFSGTMGSLVSNRNTPLLLHSPQNT
jgi:hypothetical protein